MCSSDLSPSEEISKMAETIANLQVTVGTIQSDLSKVSSSVGSDVSEMRKMFETIMMGKPKAHEDSPIVSDGESKDEDTLLDPLQVEANISKAKAKAAKKDKEGEKAEASKSSTANGSGANARVPPPSSFDSIHPIISMPHIHNVGPPPMLNTKEFSMWKFDSVKHGRWSNIVNVWHGDNGMNRVKATRWWNFCIRPRTISR